ncbi:MAG: bis(5'-nucleosyl)-tetraphosphatase (symmetrical) YqeK [Atopobiaceae bacterium]|nr:bis(5'-nucleosyl)-tetraphosphatase (symmetrical) YqeK [Atopobiaceae bacterium]
MAWKWSFGTAAYTPEEQATIERLEADLNEHMRLAKPKRYAHSLSVAKTAEQMALAYDVSPFEARVAGILHDWDKVLNDEEQIARAQELGVDLGVDARLVCPLLHGMTAARALKDRYPELPDAVWQAIDRHTIGAADMTPLDMVVFVADGVEPIRKDVPAICHVRDMIEAHELLAEVFWSSFSLGVAYVIQTERYLYPGTLDIYNELVLRRAH